MKKSTFFCDIDGTLFNYRKFETYKSTIPVPVSDNIDLLNSAFDNGNCIILTTARPEYLRTHTLKELNESNVKYHRLIMGIERGTRFLINDKEDPSVDRAISININRNQAFTSEQKNTIKSTI